MSVFEQYSLVGDTSAAGDNLYLICRRCTGPDPVIPVTVRRFSTNYGEPVVTLQDVWDAARAHDGEFHEGFTKGRS